MEDEYYYHHAEMRLVPFEGRVCIRAPRDDEKMGLDRKCGDSYPLLLMEDNGRNGDGLICRIGTDVTPDDDPLVWFRLTLPGARALRDTLDHFLRLRDVEAGS